MAGYACDTSYVESSRWQNPSCANAARKPLLEYAALCHTTWTDDFDLPYEAVRQSDSPEKILLDFMQSTYEVGANLDKWNRAELERTSDSWLNRKAKGEF
jgi:Family of unknown function (DUF5996)